MRELCKIMQHFFPDLNPLLAQRIEPRHVSYITYTSQVLLFTRILAAVFRIGSMRRLTESFNNEACIENVRKILHMETLSELPHWSTLNDYLEKLEPAEIEYIIPKLIYRLIRMRSFEESRIRNKYWQILVDGSQLITFHEPHCPHCLTREHKDQNGNIVRTDYYHFVLEAKLVIHGNIVVSIATVFVENDAPNVSKQDCELKAFYRLAEKLKCHFPRLPICLSMDSLYACGPVFDVCRHNNWHYIIRFKDGSIPSVAEEFHMLKTMEPNQTFFLSEEGVTKTYSFVTGIPYQSHSLNVVEFTQSQMAYPFVFVTDLPLTPRNCERTVEDGRRRWKIENEGFNEQKNHGFALTHLFSKNYTAMKNHYFLIQIGHMIAQFLEEAIHVWSLIRAPSYMVFQVLKQAFQTTVLSNEDMMQSLNRRRQYRFP